MATAPPPLSQGERQFRLLADHVPVMVWRCRADGCFDFFNASWLAFTGRTLDEELGSGWADNLHPDDRNRCLATFDQAFAGRERFAVECRLKHGRGAYRWITLQGTPAFDEASGFLGYVGCGIDIHQHRRIRQALAASRRVLRHREMLLAEIGHRTKNMVQMIVSLLGLLAGRTSRGAAAALQEAAQRVRSLGLVHEMLHRRRGAEVDLGVYLREIAATLLDLAGQRNVRLEMRVERVRMPADRAVSLGLIVNEIVTNALKYAFPDGREGVVTIGVHRGKDGMVEVSVADDGVGMPEDVWPPRGRTSLGLSLVQGLARQSGASVTLRRDGGTCFVLHIDLDKHRWSRSQAGTSDTPQAAATPDTPGLATSG